MTKEEKDTKPVKLSSLLTEEMLVEYREAFDFFDLNGTQRISTADVLQLMRKIGLMPSNKEVEDMLNEVDKDGTVSYEGMTFEMFCQLASRKVADVYTPTKIIEAFRSFDVEEDGFLSVASLREALMGLGEQLTEDEMDALIEAAAPDQDGNIYYEEFVNNIMAD